MIQAEPTLLLFTSQVLRPLWQGLLGFVYDYPLIMSYAWMLFAVLAFLRSEYRERHLITPPEADLDTPVSILIPCFNEGDHALETISQALAVNYAAFEVIAINDGSCDRTGAILDYLAGQHPRLRVVHFVENQGKALALQAGSLLARSEILICIDGDALLDAQAIAWMARHFIHNPQVGAVTGNPRIRNRSTLLGRVQVGEFSSIIGLIKRAQSWFGPLFTVSGVICAFRKSALHQVGYWSAEMLTEDIDITWKLQRAGWRVIYEPHALVWILMPETLKGLWKQRLRWAMGGTQVLLKNLNIFRHPRQLRLWVLMAEMILTLIWAYTILLLVCLWGLNGMFGGFLSPDFNLPLLPETSGLLLGITCLIQFGLSLWLDSPYDRYRGEQYYWMIWYPCVFWMVVVCTSIVALPLVLRRQGGQRARWVSPDRGMKI